MTPGMIRLSLVIIFILTITGCATISEWFASATHGCTYVNKEGETKGPIPMTLKEGQPLKWEQEGWSVTCEPYAEV